MLPEGGRRGVCIFSRAEELRAGLSVLSREVSISQQSDTYQSYLQLWSVWVQVLVLGPYTHHSYSTNKLHLLTMTRCESYCAIPTPAVLPYSNCSAPREGPVHNDR